MCHLHGTNLLLWTTMVSSDNAIQVPTIYITNGQLINTMSGKSLSIHDLAAQITVDVWKSNRNLLNNGCNIVCSSKLVTASLI